MEVPVTAHSKGFMKIASNGTPEKIDLSEYVGRYVEIMSPDDDIWFNSSATDGTAATMLGDRTTESSAPELAADGTVLPKLAPMKFGKGLVIQSEEPFFAFEPNAGAAVRIFFHPSSDSGKPAVG